MVEWEQSLHRLQSFLTTEGREGKGRKGNWSPVCEERFLFCDPCVGTFVQEEKTDGEKVLATREEEHIYGGHVVGTSTAASR